MCGVSGSQFLISADRYCDFIPGVSTLSNTVNIAQKLLVLPALERRGLEKNHYFSYLGKKPYGACVLAAVPVIGNLAVALIEARWRADLAILTTNPELLEQLIHRQQNPEFVKEALIVNPKVLEYLPTDLQGNWRYIKTLMKVPEFRTDHETMLDCLRKGGIEVFHDRQFPGELKLNPPFLSRVFEKSFPRQKEFLSDRAFMLEVFRCEPSLAAHTDPSLRQYRDFWLAAYEVNKDILKYLPEEPVGEKQILFAYIRGSYPQATPPPGIDQGLDPWAQRDSQVSLHLNSLHPK